MNCSTIQPLLDAYLDGELDLDQHLPISEHLQTCPNCSAVHARLDRLHNHLHSESFRFKAPADLRQAVVAAIRKPASLQFRVTGLPWKWIALAASLLFTISAATNIVLTYRLQARGPSVAQEILSEHVRSLLTGHLIDVASSDRHTVKPWFAGKLDFSPDVKDLSAQGFPLIGGRVDYLDGRPVAALVFQRAKHLVSLFIWPSEAHSQTLSQNGYQVIVWNKDGMTYWAVSDLNLTELQQFSQAYTD